MVLVIYVAQARRVSWFWNFYKKEGQRQVEMEGDGFKRVLITKTWGPWVDSEGFFFL